MTVASHSTPGFASQCINAILAIKPLAAVAKHQARQMMIRRAETIGVAWTEEVAALKARGQQVWDNELAQITNPDLVYPDYYLTSFHAYDQGNLSWDAATEVEVAAHAVHAKIWPDAGAGGDARLRQSYHDVLKSEMQLEPGKILDLGCSVGMSTLALQATFPQAQMTGVDLSPYFLAIAQHRARQHQHSIHWVHAAAEATGLPAHSFDLVSFFLVYHELPNDATRTILKEARRLLQPGGYLAIMDMNPKSDIYQRMPPYILTLLKSTEPYLDDYFRFDFEREMVDAGFAKPVVRPISPRHRTLIAQAV